MTEPAYPAPLPLDPAWTADTVAVQAGRPGARRRRSHERADHDELDLRP